jgi:hypothetical protein
MQKTIGMGNDAFTSDKVYFEKLFQGEMSLIKIPTSLEEKRPVQNIDLFNKPGSKRKTEEQLTL